MILFELSSNKRLIEVRRPANKILIMSAISAIGIEGIKFCGGKPDISINSLPDKVS